MIVKLNGKSNSQALKEALAKIKAGKVRPTNLQEFLGILPRDEDPVAIQRRLRDGW